MTTELMNKIIKYMMARPYSEVYGLMDEIREAIKVDSTPFSAPLDEEQEEVDG